MEMKTPSEVTKKLTGRIDAKTSPAWQQELEALVTPEVKTLILNMSEVEFLASMGIRVLLTMFKKLKANGGTMKIVEPSAFVYETLSLVGLASELVDESTVKKDAEDELHCTCMEAFTVSEKRQLDNMTKEGYPAAEKLMEKLGASKRVRNIFLLTLAELDKVQKLNRDKGYSREIECTITYEPDAKKITFKLEAFNHRIEHLLGNMSQLSGKPITGDNIDENLGEMLAERAWIQFWNTHSFAQEGDNVVGILTLDLK